jgi:hypothetical protein
MLFSSENVNSINSSLEGMQKNPKKRKLNDLS